MESLQLTLALKYTTAFHRTGRFNSYQPPDGQHQESLVFRPRLAVQSLNLVLNLVPLEQAQGLCNNAIIPSVKNWLARSLKPSACLPHAGSSSAVSDLPLGWVGGRGPRCQAPAAGRRLQRGTSMLGGTWFWPSFPRLRTVPKWSLVCQEVVSMGGEGQRADCSGIDHQLTWAGCATAPQIPGAL